MIPTALYPKGKEAKVAHESLIEKLQGIQVKAFGKRRTAVEILDELTEDELSVWFKAMLEEGIQEGKIL